MAIALSVTFYSACALADALQAAGDATYERLQRVIRETVAPKGVGRKPLDAESQALLVWSEPVNGLAARIDNVWAETAVNVRLKNLSKRPLRVPTGNPADAAPWFELHVRQGSHPWRQMSKSLRYGQYFAGPVDQREDRKPADPPWMTLQPGEEGVALVVAFDSKDNDTGEQKFVKGILRLPAAGGADSWTGVLETPPHSLEWPREQRPSIRAAVPFPDHFPQFSYDFSGFINMSLNEPAVTYLHGPNRPLIDMLSIYEPAGVRKEFERRMQAEKFLPMKLLLASVAAAAGSEQAALLFLQMSKDTDYLTVTNLHYALWITFWNYSGGPPDWQKREAPSWLVELSLAILADDRQVTGPEKTTWERGTSFTVSSQARNLRFAVSDRTSPKAVLLLIDRLKKGQADFETFTALGASGDKRAIGPLTNALDAAATTSPYHRDVGLHQEFEQAAYALAKLKAKEAVPSLLKYVEYPEIVECLAEIGDSRALPALREMVTRKGKVTRGGEAVNPELEDRRVFAARMALARFAGADEVPRLAEMLTEPTLTRNHRYDVVMRLGGRADPRAIPYLVKVIQTDSDYYIIDLAIQGLADRKERAAVVGLIECFDAPFREFKFGKGERETPATIRNEIARCLQGITRQTFGADKNLWRKWWQETGSKSPALK
jgi:HEAT repeat protein